MADARNAGIDNARGRWRCRVDGDDWVEPDTVGLAERYAKTYKDRDALIWDACRCLKDARKKHRFPGRETRLKPRQGRAWRELSFIARQTGSMKITGITKDMEMEG